MVSGFVISMPLVRSMPARAAMSSQRRTTIVNTKTSTPLRANGNANTASRSRPTISHPPSPANVVANSDAIANHHCCEIHALSGLRGIGNAWFMRMSLSGQSPGRPHCEPTR